MNMPKIAGVVFITMGAVLFISALLLFLYNRQEEEAAGQQSLALLESVQDVISEQAEPVSNEPARVYMPATDEPDTDEQASEEAAVLTPDPTPRPTEMSVVEIDGYGYIGFLSIPSLGVELPVMSEWDYVRLKIAPCRQFGTTWTDDLVIAAHNYKTHFGNLSVLQEGETVLFTDMNGLESQYAVAAVETLLPTSVDEVQNSSYDLVLYTCTYGGATRVVVFCERIET